MQTKQEIQTNFPRIQTPIRSKKHEENGGEGLTVSGNELRRLINMKNTNFFTLKTPKSPIKQAHCFLYRLADSHMDLIIPIVLNNFRQLGRRSPPVKPKSETRRRRKPRKGFRRRAMARRV